MDNIMLAKKITNWREQTGLTQQQVADTLGLSRQRYILIEQGERDITTTELGLLSNVFGVAPADFFADVTDIHKFRQMYFACLKFGADARGGVTKTKLAKLLYLVDFSKYYQDLQPMSGVKYRRLEYGPVADLFFSLTDDLFLGGKIDIRSIERAQIISATTKEADNFDRLSKDELKLIKEICVTWKNRRTEEIVNFTHEQKPWKMCRDGEFIPYSLIIQEDPDHVFQPLT